MKRVLFCAIFWGVIASFVGAEDCNENAVDDAQDISSGTSADCNANGIPDECDVEPGYMNFIGAARVLAEGGGLAVADMDGIGLPDIVTTSFGVDPDDPGNEFFCSPNRGDGFFWEPTAAPCPEYPEVVACADLDGDGDRDVVVSAGRYPFVKVFRNDGGLAFTAGAAWSISGGALALGDVSGDGLPDIVTTGRSRTDVSVIINRGAWSFAAPVNYACGAGPSSVVLADFSGDGDLDIATADSESGGALVKNTVSILENLGDGTFAGSKAASLKAPATRLFAGDVNGDGRIDLVAVVPSIQQIAVLKRGPKGLFFISYYGTAQDPSAIAGGDLDGDKDIDLCVANGSGTTQIFLNGGTGNFRVSRGTLPSAGNLAISDLDGDGDRDVVVHTTVYRNNGAARFVSAMRLATGDGPESVALEDFNGDGLLDIAAACESSEDVSVILQNSPRSFGTAQSYAAGATLAELAAGDVDGDGDVDLVAANRGDSGPLLLKNTGNGSFAAPVGLAVMWSPDDVALGDIDGDGDLDLAVSDSESTLIRVLRNQGNGTFETPLEVDADAYVVDVALADMTGDGDVDIVVGAMASPEVVVIENLGGGSFAPVPETSLGIFEDMYVAVGDLDGDGDSDAAAWLDEFIDPDGGTFEVTTRLKIFENVGSGSLEARLTIVKGGRPYGIALADLDGDTRVDVAGLTSHDHVLLHRNLGGFGLGSPSAWHAGSQGDVAAGDLDGDGKPDLVAADKFGDRVVVLFNDTAFPVSHDANGNDIPDECEGVPFVRGDGNGDGDIDVSDAIYVLGYLFLGLDYSTCVRSADLDGNAAIEISDAIYLMQYLYLGGDPPPAPFPDCGRAEVQDELECASFASCTE